MMTKQEKSSIIKTTDKRKGEQYEIRSKGDQKELW